MELELTDIEVRVVGSLIEKERTTPDQYPLTLNALTAACNQKSNREPVMTLTESDVTEALDSLRSKHLAWRRTDAGARVPKYEHNCVTYLGLSDAECAVLCVLMLRGPQTVGEIRTRTGRMQRFGGLSEVEDVLAGLASRAGGPMVKELPRRPGHKESRYVHLLAGEPALVEEAAVAEESLTEAHGGQSRLDRLEEQVSVLRDEVAALREELAGFKRQFE